MNRTFHSFPKDIMKRLLLSSLLCASLLALVTPAAAQFTESRLPIYYNMHGGLFFPSRENFRATYRSGSDIVWGFGLAFPITDDFLYLVTDIAWFSSEAVVDAPGDSTMKLQQRFIHLGLLEKVFFSQRDAVRAQAGVSYSTVKESSASLLAGEQSRELPKKFGYFGGIGIEHIPGTGGFSIYSDLLYEYRHSLEKDFSGDFGGLRLEVGINVYFN